MSDDQALQRVIEKVRKADTANPSKEVKAEFSRMLQEQPTFWRVAGDMVEQAARHLLAAASGTSYAVKASMTKGWEQLPVDLAHPGDGELERLLIQQITIAWLHLGYVQYQYSAMTTSADTTIKRGEYWERRLSAAQRRYLRAVESLARVRRLQLPAVQVNIAEQQVNQVNVSGMGEHSG